VGKFLLVMLLFAFLVYGVLRLLDSRRAGVAQRRRPDAAPPRRAVAPDDDDEFLRGLRKRRPDKDGKDEGRNNGG
jgi:hypothetical protein